MKYEVTMICRQILRAKVVVDAEDGDLEDVKDKAWAEFDANASEDLEQENFTKVEVLKDSDANI